MGHYHWRTNSHTSGNQHSTQNRTRQSVDSSANELHGGYYGAHHSSAYHQARYLLGHETDIPRASTTVETHRRSTGGFIRGQRDHTSTSHRRGQGHHPLSVRTNNDEYCCGSLWALWYAHGQTHHTESHRRSPTHRRRYSYTKEISLTPVFHPLSHTTPEELPSQFTYPFHYQAHPLCVRASQELQAHLSRWQWKANEAGKMFGVLLVENNQGEIGYLWAYSGNLLPGMDKTLFVPPIYDLQMQGSFFTNGEKALTLINEQITTLETDNDYVQLTQKINEAKAEQQSTILSQKRTLSENKKARKQQREEAKHLSQEDYEQAIQQLNKESQFEKAELKRATKQWEKCITNLTEQRQALATEIDILKKERKAKSNQLQQQIFDQYQLRNAKGEIKGLSNIFQETEGKQAPAGAGDCAAPRLLQYAYLNELKPLAMAEFWWGKSPLSEVRKQGNFYPSCKGKCEPILGHMLGGLDVEDNPLLSSDHHTIDVIYNDEYLMAINKPSGLLSTPGKGNQPAILDLLHHTHPDAKSYTVVHRLDMATSGIVLIAKDATTYKHLQAQFIDHTIKKRYDAVLDGIIAEDSGTIELPLRVDLDNRPQQLVCYEYGKHALTHWKVISRTESTTHVAFFPQTGRTHQLRVHAAHQDGLNSPIIGDELYGTKASRLHLHASFIEFVHPVSGENVKLCSPVPF